MQDQNSRYFFEAEREEDATSDGLVCFLDVLASNVSGFEKRS